MILRQCFNCQQFIFKEQTKIIGLETLKDGKIRQDQVIWCKRCLKEITNPEVNLDGKKIRLEE